MQIQCEFLTSQDEQTGTEANMVTDIEIDFQWPMTWHGFLSRIGYLANRFRIISKQKD
jgi:hypothetical protein